MSRGRGAIAWMAHNTVAANLLMALCFVGGLAALFVFGIKQEVFPEFQLDLVNVSVPYPGASPSEVEQGIVLAVEESVRGLDGVKRITSVAREGLAVVSVELLLGAEADKVLSDVKNAVDRIQSFPEDAERPTISIATRRREVISLVLSGPHERSELHTLAELAREELLATGKITQIEIFGLPDPEISIEVSRETLKAYGLSLEGIARQIRGASIELPAGELKTERGRILVRVADRRREGSEFANVVVKSTSQGQQLRLGDIAEIRDAFQDSDIESYYGGQPAVRVTAYRVGTETPRGIASVVRTYAEDFRLRLPETMQVAIWNDDSKLLDARLDLLSRNAQLGLVLVVFVLGLFLRPNLAMWVALGIPISFFGALALLPALGISINMVTTFAFIITLGLVVDDAIIVGENIFQKLEAGEPPLKAAVTGAKEMSVPVTFSVLTTVAAFSPLFFVPGTMGKIFMFIPSVVIAVLCISLVESFYILPAHLSHARQHPWLDWLLTPITWLQSRVSGALVAFIRDRYRPGLSAVLEWRGVTIAVGIVVLAGGFALLRSGAVPWSFFPKLEGNIVVATARLPFGTNIDRTRQVQRVLEDSALRARDDFGEQHVDGVFTRVGEGPRQRGPGGGARAQGGHLVTVEVALVSTELRSFSARDFSNRWQEKTGALVGLESLVFEHGSGPGAGAAVDVQLSHSDVEVLGAASLALATELRGFYGLTNVQNEYAAGKEQLDFQLMPRARELGLSASAVARELRGAFFGVVARREQRGRKEVKVMVRLPEAQRRSEYDLDSLEIGTAAGHQVPLSYVARFKRGRSPTEINREDGRRIINVRAELAPTEVSAQGILEQVTGKVLPSLQDRFAGLDASLVGQQRSQGETFSALRRLQFLSFFVIFALLAIPFRSYVQPLIVMSAIPFGVVGAILGHWLMGFELSLISILGMVALTGVVINDSLVLIDATNRERAAGLSAKEAVVSGAARRVRPIVLTSLTTFFGLAPMILETSMQARFLVPMAISLGYGVLFATIVVLVFVPVVYTLVEDVRTFFLGDSYGAH